VLKMQEPAVAERDHLVTQHLVRSQARSSEGVHHEAVFALRCEFVQQLRGLDEGLLDGSHRSHLKEYFAKRENGAFNASSQWS
jgi:hypothetical protein